MYMIFVFLIIVPFAVYLLHDWLDDHTDMSSVMRDRLIAVLYVFLVVVVYFLIGFLKSLANNGAL